MQERQGRALSDSKLMRPGVRSFRARRLITFGLMKSPPADIYTEALTRTNLGASPVWLTFTPLQGVSTVVKRFLHKKSDDRHKVVMTFPLKPVSWICCNGWSRDALKYLST
jgi:phage terminase large subunit-like protein